MALYSVRNVPLFAIVAMPFLAGLLSEWLASHHHRLKALERLYHADRRILDIDLKLRGAFLPGITIVLALAGLRSGMELDFQRAGNRFDPRVFPVEATDWLVKHPQAGRPFNYFPWGGYLLYRLWPNQTVFIDGQTDFYGEELTRQYEQVLTLSPGWEDILEQYAVDWVIFPAGEALAVELRGQPGWTMLYEDPTAIIFGRSGP